MSYLTHLLVLVLNGLLLTSTNGNGLVDSRESAVSYRHAANIARIKQRISEETGIYDNARHIAPDRLTRLRAVLDESEFDECSEAFEYVNLLGHSEGNSSNVIFEYGQMLRSQHLEAAKLIFFIRRPSSPHDKKISIQVTDENANLVYVEVAAPTTSVKKHVVELSKETLERSLSSSESTHLLTINMSARTIGDAFEDLLMLPGRLGHMPHMGILLEVQIRSQRARRRRELSRRGQCRDTQETCCVDIFEVDWRALNITHVIAPAKFSSAVCRGSCEEFEYMGYSYTARRQQLLNNLKRPCCHPVEFRDGHLMWVDQNGNVHARNIPSYAPSRCSCD